AETVVLVDGIFASDDASGPAAPPRTTAPPAEGADAIHAADLAWWAELGALFMRHDGATISDPHRAALARFSERRAAAPDATPPADPRHAPSLARHPDLAGELRAIARDLRARRDAARAAGRPVPRCAVLLPTLEGVTPVA